MNKRDFIAVFLAAVLSAAGFLYFSFNHPTGAEVKITVGGKIFGTYPLETDKKVKVKTENGFNIVEIKNGKVSVKDADCRDKYCVNQGEIESGSIICLPHKTVVEIMSDKNTPDAVAE